MAIRITELLVSRGWAKSNKEAKRMIREGGFKINDVIVDDPSLVMTHYKESVLVIGHHDESGDGTFYVHPCSLKKEIRESLESEGFL